VSDSQPQFISSAANPLLKDLRRLAQDSTAYRKQGRIWLEGDHLCSAALERGVQPAIAVFSESAWQAQASRWTGVQGRIVHVSDSLFASISALDSPGHMGFVLELPPAPAIDPAAPSVILDRLQDAGNVGSILRSAAAFGFRQVLSLKGTAGLWSPKVLRSGMGAHFTLSLIEGVEVPDLEQLAIPLVATSSHRGEFLHEAQLPWPCGWMLGHEGQGVSQELAARAASSVRIMQPGGEESLNVAAAAAICLHASACRGTS
jgi:RNA methyltransferase, TrmH family